MYQPPTSTPAVPRHELSKSVVITPVSRADSRRGANRRRAGAGTRLARPARLAALAWGISVSLLGLSARAHAGTEYDVITGSSLNLTLAGSYTVGGTAAVTPPATTSDVTFTATNTYTNATASPFTVPASLSIGSLNDLSATSIFIRNQTGSSTTTLTLNGGDTVAGSDPADLIYVAAGAMTIGNASSGTGVLNLALAASGNFDVAAGATLSIGSTVSGGALTKTGAGTLTLTNAANTFSSFTLSAGSVNISNAGALGTGTFTVGDGTTFDKTFSVATALTNSAYNLNGAFTFTGTNSLSLGTGAVTLGANTTAAVSASTLTINGVVSGGALTKTGAGTLTLTNTANTFSSFTLSAGSVNIGNAGALGTGTFTIGDGTTFNNTSGGVATLTNSAYNLNGAFTFTATNSLSLGTGAVTLGANTTATVNTNSLTINGAIGDGANTFSLTKAGTGTLTLSGANTFKGGLTLSTGALNINNNSALGTGAFTLSGGTLGNSSAGPVVVSNAVSLGGSATFVPAVAGSSLEFAGPTTLTAASTLTVNTGTGGAPLIVSGAVGGGFGLTRAGAGTLTLSGNNTFSGGLTFNNGSAAPSQLNLNSATALGTGTFTVTGGTFATLDNTSGAAVTQTNNNAISIGGNFAFAGSNALDLGAGVVTLTGAAGITTTANTLTLGGPISGAFALSKAGAGTLNLTGTGTNGNTGMAVSAGTLNVSGSFGSGTAAGGSVASVTGGTLNELSTAALTGVGTVTANGGAASLGGVNSYSGATTLGSSAAGGATSALTLIANAANTTGGVSSAASANSALTINRLSTVNLRGDTDAAFNFASVAAPGLTGGTSTYNFNVGSATGGTTGRVLALDFKGGSLGIAGITSTVNVTGTSGYTANLGSITLPASTTFNTASGLTLQTSTPSTVTNLMFTGAGNFRLGSISATTAATFSTTGTSTLTTANAYTGATNVTAGTLRLNTANALSGTSRITVTGGGMLQLTANSALATPVVGTAPTGAQGTSGTALNQVPITLGDATTTGTLLRNGVGVSAGTGTTVGLGALTLSNTAVLDFGTAGVGTLNFNGFIDTGNSNLNVLDYSRTTAGTAAGVDGLDDRLIFNQNLTSAQLSNITFNGLGGATEIALGNGEFEIVAPVPEPSTWVSALMGVAVIGYSRRKDLRSLAGRRAAR